mgnify:CR=1 FL=1|tara:strand:- start:643 stop:804 length:162 start_codon:yes stop_codon:yes gene_type:complete
MSDNITLIGNDYYEIIDNSDCNAADDYILVSLGPYFSWRAWSAHAFGDDELPF